jgi:hypothetical protein
MMPAMFGRRSGGYIAAILYQTYRAVQLQVQDNIDETLASGDKNAQYDSLRLVAYFSRNDTYH